MNKNNLNRIKGILSAKQGTLVPKFLGGYTIYHKSTNQPLYSPDGISWYTDQMYSNLFNRNTNDYTTPNLQLQFYTKNSNVIIPGLNNITPINILDSSIVSNALNNIQPTQSLNKPYDLIQNPVSGISGVTNFVNYNGPSASEEIDIDVDTSAKLPTKSAIDVLNDMKKSFTPPERTISHVETNIKLSKEDRLLSRQLRREERLKETLEYLDNLSNKDIRNGQLFISGMDAISDIGSVVGASLQATDSELTKNITTGYDAVANVASNFGPMGQIVGGAMKTLGALGDISQAMGGGTDQQTKLDSWMDSPLLSWNIGILNGFAGKNTDSFGVDLEALATVGSSYGGTATSINEAAESADKEYGLFSGKSRKKANDVINKAKQQQNLMKNIADLASDQRLAVQSMGEQAGLAYSMMTNGGYDLKYTYAAKQGGIINWEPKIELNWEPKIKFNLKLPEFKEEGLLEKIDWTPKLQKGNKIRTLEELIEYAKKENPRFIQRLSEKPRGIKFINDEGKESEGNVYLEWSTDNKGNAIIYPRIQEFEDGILKFLSSNEAYNRAIDNNNVLIMSPEEAEIFFAPDEEYQTAYKRGWPAMFKSSILKHKQGGSVKESDIPEIEETNLKNVIPEGALHKNKHHMEHAEGLTKKGIPVIDEEGEQQAEIEHSEIIFTLEVTKKLEEYYQIFYSEESTNKEKEQAALDAGKLLVYQILENTEDRTGLIESCKKGGILKKSMTNLTKEVINDTKDSSKKELMKNIIKEMIIELLTE